MKKTLVSIALVLASVMGTANVFAQTTATTPANKEQKMQKGERSKDKKAYNPFEGINLTEKQQNELKALKDSRKAEKAQAKADAQKEKKDMKAKRQNDRKEYLAKIKGILTPEQYVQFLENSFLSKTKANMAPRGQKGGKDGKFAQRDGKKGQRDGKMGQRDGKKGQRGQRGQMPKQQARQ